MLKILKQKVDNIISNILLKIFNSFSEEYQETLLNEMKNEIFLNDMKKDIRK